MYLISRNFFLCSLDKFDYVLMKPLHVNVHSLCFLKSRYRIITITCKNLTRYLSVLDLLLNICLRYKLQLNGFIIGCYGSGTVRYCYAAVTGMFSEWRLAVSEKSASGDSLVTIPRKSKTLYMCIGRYYNVVIVEKVIIF